MCKCLVSAYGIRSFLVVQDPQYRFFRLKCCMKVRCVAAFIRMMKQKSLAVRFFYGGPLQIVPFFPFFRFMFHRIWLHCGVFI